MYQQANGNRYKAAGATLPTCTRNSLVTPALSLAQKPQAGAFITPQTDSTLHWWLSQHTESMPGFLKLCFYSLGLWRYSNTRRSHVQNAEVMAFQHPRHPKPVIWPHQPFRCPQTRYKLSIPKCSNNTSSIVAISLQISFEWEERVKCLQKRNLGVKRIYTKHITISYPSSLYKLVPGFRGVCDPNLTPTLHITKAFL